MKALVSILAAITALMSTASFAAERTMVPVIEYKMLPGYGPRPTTRTLSIYPTGKVEVKIEDVRGINSEPQQFTVAQLERPVITGIQRIVAGLEFKRLVDLEPETPKCMDAPSHVFVAYIDGEAREFFSIQNCKEYGFKDWSSRGNAEVLKRLLDGLRVAFEVMPRKR